MNITAHEFKIIDQVDIGGALDFSTPTCFIPARRVYEEVDIPTRSIPGVVASLVKKGLAVTMDDDEQGPMISITDTGWAASERYDLRLQVAEIMEGGA